MASATKTALDALFSALSGTTGLPTLGRNEDLSSRLEDMDAGVSGYGNLWDGRQLPNEEDQYLGADAGVENAYGIVHEARLELVFLGGSLDDRETAYDTALTAIHDMLAADRTLGDAVDRAELGQLEGQGSGLITDGVANAKGVIVPIVMEFRSSRPF